MSAKGINDVSKPIRDIAYETLKQAIITGELPAGSRIVETVYANKLHISRTPLREAFRKLELDGLVSCEVRRVSSCAPLPSMISKKFTHPQCADAADYPLGDGKYHR